MIRDYTEVIRDHMLIFGLPASALDPAVVFFRIGGDWTKVAGNQES